MFEAGLLENSEILVQHASQLAEGIIRCISKDQNSNVSSILFCYEPFESQNPGGSFELIGCLSAEFHQK